VSGFRKAWNTASMGRWTMIEAEALITDMNNPLSNKHHTTNGITIFLSIIATMMKETKIEAAQS
jgi:hypothetical protein